MFLNIAAVTSGLQSVSFVGHPLCSHKKCGGYSLVCWRKC